MQAENRQARVITYKDVFQSQKTAGDVQNIRLDELHDFPNHPFKVADDDAMKGLIQSIRVNGVMTPIIVRPVSGNGYEILSGHRRTHACRRIGLLYIPALVRNLSDEEAVDLMVDSNLQRERILPSEKAYAYSMQLDCLRHQGRKGEATPEAIGKKYGDSASKVLRYARLTHLNPDLLGWVDEGILGVQAGYTLSFLPEKEQRWVADCGREHMKYPNGRWPSHLRNLSEEGLLTREKVKEVISGKIRERRSVELKPEKLKEYFPDEWSVEDMEHTILMLLSSWKDSQMLKKREEE